MLLWSLSGLPERHDGVSDGCMSKERLHISAGHAEPLSCCPAKHTSAYSCSRCLHVSSGPIVGLWSRVGCKLSMAAPDTLL